MAAAQAKSGIDRRTLLIGGGAAVGLVVAWELWPRSYAPNLAAAPGEAILGAFLKIDTAGRVTVVVPQAEMGQGIWTALAQALADELGADWRQVAVEPAPIGPLYANRLIAGEYEQAAAPQFLSGISGWAAREWATRHALMITAGSTSVRAFEQPFREAGAFARALLCMAAGKRIGADWRACDTEAGFVVRGNDRFRFGELAAEAAAFTPPAQAPLRKPGEGNISGKAMPRLDLPSKLDGSARYAGDVRLPNMVYASIRHGPLGDTHLASQDMAVAYKVSGVIGVVRGDGWIAALADNWWAADHALDQMRLRFETRGPLAGSADIAKALDTALADGGKVLTVVGKPDPDPSGPGVIQAVYETSLAAHATIEPLVATARMNGDTLELWAPTQAPGLTRAAVARAAGLSEGRITLYPMQIGGGFGRKLENDAACEAAILAIRAKRPVQLMWGRPEEMLRARHGPPAKVRLSARLGPQGQIARWSAIIAAPSSEGEAAERLTGAHGASGANMAAVDGAIPPYAIPLLAISHAPADIGVETGIWRSGAHAYTAFFTESFVDELAVVASVDPLSFRMGLLSGSPRLARCLAQAAASGGWSGAARSGQGLACHSAFGSHIAVCAEADDQGGAIAVKRMVAVVDCGRAINPDIVAQQIESGLIWGMGQATGDRITCARGLTDQTNFDALGLPWMKGSPDISVEIIASGEAPGGVAELAVPVAAPAIANALFSATGKRMRSLPLA